MNNYFLFKNKFRVRVEEYKSTLLESHQDITLILLPAIGVPIKKYQKFINCLNQAGYNVIAADYPCCGMNQPHINRNRDYGYKDLIDEFIPQLIGFSDSQNTVLLGHSLGGHIATLYATKNKISIIGVATGNIHYKNWQGFGRFNLIRAVLVFKLFICFYGYLSGYKLGFGLKEAKTLMNNWCHTALTGNYNYFAPWHKKAKGHGIFINIKGDNFSPYQSTKKLAEMFSCYTLECIEISPELKGNKHSNWLKQPDTIVGEITNKIGQIC